MSGYICDFRKELESDIWLMPPMYHRVWQWIKYIVNHSEQKIPNRIGGGYTTIKPGQRATSYRQIAKGVGYYEGLKWKEPNPKTIKVILNWLNDHEMIRIEGNAQGTVVTVVNWELYQKELTKGNAKVTPKKHSMGTNKEGLNNEEEKDLSDSNEYRLAVYLWKHILKNNPNAKEPNLESWSKQIDYMIRLDNRNGDDIKKVIEWCQKDIFWQTNILSTTKLRKQYDQLYLKMANKPNQSTTDDEYYR